MAISKREALPLGAVRLPTKGIRKKSKRVYSENGECSFWSMPLLLHRCFYEDIVTFLYNKDIKILKNSNNPCFFYILKSKYTVYEISAPIPKERNDIGCSSSKVLIYDTVLCKMTISDPWWKLYWPWSDVNIENAFQILLLHVKYWFRRNLTRQYFPILILPLYSHSMISNNTRSIQ